MARIATIPQYSLLLALLIIELRGSVLARDLGKVNPRTASQKSYFGCALLEDLRMFCSFLFGLLCMKGVRILQALLEAFRKARRFGSRAEDQYGWALTDDDLDLIDSPTSSGTRRPNQANERPPDGDSEDDGDPGGRALFRHFKLYPYAM